LIRSVQDNLLAAALPSLFPRRWYLPRRAMRVDPAVALRRD